MAKQTLHNKHRQNKHERHQIKRKQVKKARRKRQIREATATGRQVLYQITQTVNQFFPDLWDRVNTLTDPRKKPHYSLAELIGGCVALFVFKEGSRNAFNHSRMEGQFQQNYRRLFKLKLPHMDTVHALFKVLDETELERLKKGLLNVLFERKVFHKWKLLGKYFNVAVDGTGVHHFKERHCDHCLTKSRQTFVLTEENDQSLEKVLGNQISCLKPMVGKTFKKKDVLLSQLRASLGDNYVEQRKDKLLEHCTMTQVESYFHHVLEAKLITQNGFSISLGTQWIENTNKQFDKQDCESKAFKRLASQLKKDYPRLPLCIVADGLYPNEPFFKICQTNGWAFICTFKDGNLPTLHEEINELKPYNREHQKKVNYRHGERQTSEHYAWINQLDYRGIEVNWAQCVESRHNADGDLLGQTRFEYLSSEAMTDATVTEIVKAGRLRQKIENEGFNTQKNLGYNLEHKYSRTSLRASKNYYQCLQIAHMINQLYELSSRMQNQLKKWKTNLKHCCKSVMGFMMYGEINIEHLHEYCRQRVQYRYELT